MSDHPTVSAAESPAPDTHIPRESSVRLDEGEEEYNSAAGCLMLTGLVILMLAATVVAVLLFGDGSMQ